MRISFSLFCFLALAAAFSSCKKSSNDSGSGYYVKANVDGQAVVANVQASALKSQLGSNMYSLIITGFTSNEQLSLALWSEADDFTAGKTFSVDALGGTTYNVLAYSTPINSSDPLRNWTTTYDYGQVTENFSCTITEATSTYIKGTFSGTVYQDNDAAVVSKTITNGEFYAKF